MVSLRCRAHKNTLKTLISYIPLLRTIQYVRSGVTESNRAIGRRYAEKMLTLLGPFASLDAKILSLSGNRGTYQTGMVTVTADGVRLTSKGDFSYRIVDSFGALVEAGQGRSVLTAGTGFSPGLYFISVVNKTGLFTEKFIKGH